MKIVGIDQSLTNTGLATVQDGTFTFTGRISTDKMKVKGHKRIDAILDKTMETIGSGGPSEVLVGLEGPAMSAKGSAVVQIFGLYAVLTRELYRAGLTYFVATPQHVKQYATGKGNANKDEVLAAVIRRHPDIDFSSNDIADAMMIAAIGARHVGAPVETTIPARCVEVLAKVNWEHQG